MLLPFDFVSMAKVLGRVQLIETAVVVWQATQPSLLLFSIPYLMKASCMMSGVLFTYSEWHSTHMTVDVAWDNVPEVITIVNQSVDRQNESLKSN